ncbi:antibiotic biosynthesis monooxygenase [Desulfocarbo indianensis]|nr:antibiotic biosynthesis monooxygenase [Desulfocarbo indianensis]
MPLVYVTAVVTGKEAAGERLKKELGAVVPQVRRENGCLRYDLHQSAEGKPVFLFYEIWQSEEALAAHGQTPHMIKMSESIQDLLAAPPEIGVWRAVDAV